MAKRTPPPTFGSAEEFAEQYGGMNPKYKEQIAELMAAQAAGAAAGSAAADSATNTGSAIGKVGGKTSPRVSVKTSKTKASAKIVDLAPVIEQLKDVKKIQEDEEKRQKAKVKRKKLEAEIDDEAEALLDEEKYLHRELKGINEALSGSLLLKSGAKKAFEGITNFIERQLPVLGPLFDGVRSIFNTVKGIKEWAQDRKEQKLRKETIKERLKELDLLKKENDLRKKNLTKEGVSKILGATGGPAHEKSLLENIEEGAGDLGKEGIKDWFLMKLLGRGKGGPAAAEAGAGALEATKGLTGGAKLLGKAGSVGGILKGASSVVSKSPIGKVMGKLMGPLAVGFGIFEGLNRFKEGDYLGGVLSMAAGFSMLIPGWGWAASIGINLLDWFRSWLLGGTSPGAGEPNPTGKTPTSTEAPARGTVPSIGVGAKGDLVSNIFGKAEGTLESVNLGQRGKYRSSSVPGLSKMSVADVIKLQDEGRFNAAGMFQFTRDTLKEVTKNWSQEQLQETKFDEKTQRELLMSRLWMQPAVKKYLTSASPSNEDLIEAEHGMAQIFAGFISPKTGKGIYDYTGHNKGVVAPEKVGELLKSLRQNIQSGSNAPTASTATPTAVPVTPAVSPTPDVSGFKLQQSSSSINDSRSSKIQDAQSVVVNNIQAPVQQPIRPPMPTQRRSGAKDVQELLALASKLGTVALLT